MNGKMRFVAQASIMAITLGWAGNALAQDAKKNDTKADAEIIVTGSSIKGVAPVGSNLTQLSHAQIENTASQSIQQVLKSAPAVTGLQAPSQGGYGSADASGTNAPTIHGLGASASNSTLILLNGHRLPTSGANHVLADPNVIPTIALERVEVLADGASSVYGSDAVAGVINFITRKNFNGFEVDLQHGFGSNYHTNGASALWGKTWDTGSILAAYSFSDRSNLAASSRSYTKSLDLTSLGGTNQNTNKCTNPQLGATAVTYGTCSPTAWDLLPHENRMNGFISYRQDVGDKLHLTADFDYSFRKTTQNVSRGGVTATIYGAGAVIPAGRSANPYFTGTTLTSATLNFDANALFGPGATSMGSAEDFYGRLDAVYDITPAWQVNVGGVIGRDRSEIISKGTINAATFNLAVNGYTSATINGIPESVSQTLTTANAFNPFGTNTAASVLNALTDSQTYYVAKHTMRNVYAKISGELFDLPGGPVKAAVGGELVGYSLDQYHTALNGLGGASSSSLYIPLTYGRNVQSAYGELYLPVVKNGFVRAIDINVSGRVDHYSDFGTTSNPKLAINFEPFRGMKLRANWSRSFVAPALTSIGANSSGQTGESAFTYGAGTTVPGGLSNVPLSLYPTAASIPGAVCTATACNLSSVQGVLITGGNANLKPQTGTDWSVGVDFTPVQVPGLRISVTYWRDALRNGITAPASTYAFGAASLSNLLSLYPTGATAAQLSAAQGVLPQGGATTTAYWMYNYTQNNVLNLNVAGIDFEVLYRFNTKVGNFTLNASATRKTTFEQWFGADGAHFNVLGTAGFNTTFPSLKFEGRANVAYDKGPFNAVLAVNYEGGYTWWGSGVQNAIVRNAAGVPVGGGDPVKSFTTVDLHAAYTLKDVGVLRSASFFVDASNLFDKAPPFVNTTATNGAVGYDSFSANPLGRVITVGLRSKF